MRNPKLFAVLLIVLWSLIPPTKAAAQPVRQAAERALREIENRP